MNTTRQVPLAASLVDLWAAPRRVARLLVRLVAQPGQASRAAEVTVQPLDKGATTWINHPLGRQVTCETGALWLCFDGEPQDVVLEPGETHCCKKASRLSIHALSAGSVRVV